MLPFSLKFSKKGKELTQVQQKFAFENKYNYFSYSLQSSLYLTFYLLPYVKTCVTGRVIHMLTRVKGVHCSGACQNQIYGIYEGQPSAAKFCSNRGPKLS